MCGGGVGWGVGVVRVVWAVRWVFFFCVVGRLSVCTQRRSWAASEGVWGCVLEGIYVDDFGRGMCVCVCVCACVCSRACTRTRSAAVCGCVCVCVCVGGHVWGLFLGGVVCV